MIINSYEAALFTILLMVPGFVMNMGYNYLIPIREGQNPIFLIRFLVFSCFNFAITWPFLSYFVQKSYWMQYPLRWSLLLLFFLLVLPYLLGLISGIITNLNWIRNVLIKININPIHPSPTGWDYVMSKESRYVIVTLKNSENIYGLFSSNSLASSVSTEKDIFIEKIFTFSEEKGWEDVERGEGIWINGNEILHIEFRNTIEEVNNDGEE